MGKHRGSFRPGNRRRRWRQSHALSGAVFAGMAVLVAAMSEGNLGAFGIAAAFAALAVSDAHAFRHGWRLSYELPPHGKIQIARPGLSGEVARAAWAKTQEAAKDPNRPRYAFDRIPKPASLPESPIDG
jgi:hypothetical protein